MPISEDEKDKRYEVESRFTNISIKETINFISEEINVHKNLEPIGKKQYSKICSANSQESTLIKNIENDEDINNKIMLRYVASIKKVLASIIEIQDIFERNFQLDQIADRSNTLKKSVFSFY